MEKVKTFQIEADGNIDLTRSKHQSVKKSKADGIIGLTRSKHQSVKKYNPLYKFGIATTTINSRTHSKDKQFIIIKTKRKPSHSIILVTIASFHHCKMRGQLPSIFESEFHAYKI